MAATYSWIAMEPTNATNVRIPIPGYTGYTVPVEFTAPYVIPTTKSIVVGSSPPDIKTITTTPHEYLGFGLQFSDGTSATKEQPRYCRKCGAIMRLHSKVLEYDSQTCDPTYDQKVMCPYYNIWHALLGKRPHDRADRDSTGYWIRK